LEDLVVGARCDWYGAYNPCGEDAKYPFCCPQHDEGADTIRFTQGRINDRFTHEDILLDAAYKIFAVLFLP